MLMCFTMATLFLQTCPFILKAQQFFSSQRHEQNPHSSTTTRRTEIVAIKQSAQSKGMQHLPSLLYFRWTHRTGFPAEFRTAPLPFSFNTSGRKCNAHDLTPTWNSMTNLDCPWDWFRAWLIKVSTSWTSPAIAFSWSKGCLPGQMRYRGVLGHCVPDREAGRWGGYWTCPFWVAAHDSLPPPSCQKHKRKEM